ncbi:MAG: AraC family transcriptional regulator [Victivallales bacterium]|jgi:AraC-like DNA-binding protein|nr:AraC family transcriptional regulator [Victivallales bacterium]
MKKVNDLSVFRWESMPLPQHYHEMEFYHIRKRKSFRLRPLGIGHSEEELLVTGMLSEVKMRKGARYLRRNASYLSVEYVQSGELLVRQRSSAYRLNAGEVFLMQPKVEGEMLSGNAGCNKISLMIVGKLLPTYLKESRLGDIDVLTRLNPGHMERFFRQFDQCGDNPATSVERNSMLTFELLQYLGMPHGEEIPEMLALLRDELEERPGFAWSRAIMARRCNCSMTHLVRLFNQYFAMSPHRMLLEIRMRHARRLLAEEMLSIKEISNQSGYPNALNFSTEFRKRFGVSPREYRKQLSRFS